MMILCRFSVAVPSQDHTPAYHRRFTLLHTELPTIAMDPEANGTTTNRQQVFGQVLTAIPIVTDAIERLAKLVGTKP